MGLETISVSASAVIFTESEMRAYSTMEQADLPKARRKAARAVITAVILIAASIAIAEAIPAISLDSPTSFPVDI